MGFNDVKYFVIECLKNGDYRIEPRKNQMEKNLLATGEVTDLEVAEIVSFCRGTDYSVRPNHDSKQPDIHIMKPKGKYDGWYIKFHIIEPNVFFISVHLSEDT